MNDNDPGTFGSIGDKSRRVEQAGREAAERPHLLGVRFHVFPVERPGNLEEELDLGSGSNGWVGTVTSKVGCLTRIAPAPGALEVVRLRFAGQHILNSTSSGMADVPLPERRHDRGYPKTKLSRIPGVAEALAEAGRLLMPGAAFPFFLAFGFDNRSSRNWIVCAVLCFPSWSRCRLTPRPGPAPAPSISTMAIFSLFNLAISDAKPGTKIEIVLRSTYRAFGLLTKRTGFHKRLGSTLKQRLSRKDVSRMMQPAGLGNTRSSQRQPFWRAVGNSSQAAA